MTAPSRPDGPLYELLLNGEVAEFNRRTAAGESCCLRGADLRSLDLRGLQAQGIDMTDAYLRGADLRGLDLRESSLEGASLMGAKVSGTYFPRAFGAREVQMSVELGTRMRS